MKDSNTVLKGDFRQHMNLDMTQHKGENANGIVMLIIVIPVFEIASSKIC